MEKLRPPLPPSTGTREDENYQVDPKVAPAMPKQGDVQTGQPLGPAFAQMPRDAQRGAVDGTMKQLVRQLTTNPSQMTETAQGLQGSVFDTPEYAALRQATTAGGPVGAGVVYNESSPYFQAILKSLPNFSKPLRQMEQVTEYLKPTQTKFGGGSVGKTQGLAKELSDRQIEWLSGPQAPRTYSGVTPSKWLELNQRGPGATVQRFPANPERPTTLEDLAHEGFHSIYAKQSPMTQAPRAEGDRARELMVRVFRRAGVPDDEIMANLEQYYNEPSHGLVEALSRWTVNKAKGGMGVR